MGIGLLQHKIQLLVTLDNRRCYADHDFGCILVSLS